MVAIAPADALKDKMMSNINEVSARGGQVIGVVTEGDTEIADRVDDVIEIPEASDAGESNSGLHTVATPGVPHRRKEGVRRGPAEESGQDRNGRVRKHHKSGW